jgi:hypothetical protein
MFICLNERLICYSSAFSNFQIAELSNCRIVELSNRRIIQFRINPDSCKNHKIVVTLQSRISNALLKKGLLIYKEEWRD